MYPTEKGTVLESPWERVKDRLHVVFFENGTDRARDNETELLRFAVRMHLHIQYIVRCSDNSGWTLEAL